MGRLLPYRTELRNRLKRELRSEDNNAVEKTKAEIADATKDITDLRKLVSIAERIRRRSQAVQETTEDLDSQIMQQETQEKNTDKEKTRNRE